MKATRETHQYYGTHSFRGTVGGRDCFGDSDHWQRQRRDDRGERIVHSHGIDQLAAMGDHCEGMEFKDIDF